MLNGKVICIEAEGECGFTVGKVYEISDGILRNDYGETEQSIDYSYLQDIEADLGRDGIHFELVETEKENRSVDEYDHQVIVAAEKKGSSINRKPRILNLIIRDFSSLEWKLWTEPFWVDASVENPESALREAIHDFMVSGSKEAKKAINYACGCFNWGDALSSVPESFFGKYGLRRMSGHEVMDVNVEHDEILWDGSDAGPIQSQPLVQIEQSLQESSLKENGLKQKEGVCPECGSWFKYGDGGIEDGGYKYNWTCPDCGAEGEEWYDVYFSEHIVKRHGSTGTKGNSEEE